MRTLVVISMSIKGKQRLAQLKATLRKIPGLVGTVRLLKSFASPRHRSIRRLQRDKPDGLFQPFDETSFDRYPHIFSFVQERLSDVLTPRLLSFGCSTGEEVFTLRKYFPKAAITGIDINPHSIAVCRKRLARCRDTGIRFELADTPEAEPEACYDAVFCMAVLRHGELGVTRAQRCDHLIRFADFERLVEGLCRCLKPGGYLVIRHSNFRFSDAAVAAGFDIALSVLPRHGVEKTPLYGPDDFLLALAVYNDTVFRKREAA
jgi:SAM-dependent methyltransferase